MGVRRRLPARAAREETFMSVAIEVENIGKRYRIRHERESHSSYRTLRDTLTDIAKAPLRYWTREVESEKREDFWALKDVNFSIQHGEVVGIIGRNGAGKSTLLKILSRVTKPTSGQVILRGRVGSLLEVGTGFHPELNGRENIFLNGSILGMTRREIQKRFDAIVDFSGVEKFLDTPVKRYSSGMYVRLAFSVAAHLNPEILIVDEVLAVGDAEFQRKCLGKLSEVSRSGRTILLVSHQMPSIEKLCDSAILLSAGAVAEYGPTSQVIAKYLAISQRTASSSYKAAAPGKESAYLLSAETLDSEGLPCDTLRFGEPFSIRMRWHHKTSLNGVLYGFRLFDSQERDVFRVNTRSQEHLDLNRPGDHFVTTHFPVNILPPGDYFVTIAAWQHVGGGVVQALERCLRITVDSAPFYSDHRFEVAGSPAAAVRAIWRDETGS